MRIRLSAIALLVVIAMMLVGIATAQKSSNLSTKWTLHSYTEAAIYGDSLPDAQYVDGERGVSAVIWTTGTKPTYDAVLQVSRPRAVVFDFLDSWLGDCSGQDTGDGPPWMNGSPFSSPVLINVKNILAGDPVKRQEEYWLSTRLVLQVLNAPDGRAYNLRMAGCRINPDPNDCAISCAEGALDIDCPMPTSNIWVHHVPANAGQREYWEVSPVLNGSGWAVGNLLDANKFGTVTCDSVSRGQFNLPFSIRIDVK